MPIFIDGYNLLCAIQKASDEFESMGDVRLCRILGRYLSLTNQKGRIIFDGTGPPDKSRFDDISNLEVLFVGRDTDADTVIEDSIRASTAAKNLTIVSNDRRVQKATRTRKAVLIKSEAFWTVVQKELSRKRPAKEPAEKRQGLSESETEQWMKFFKLKE